MADAQHIQSTQEITADLLATLRWCGQRIAQGLQEGDVVGGPLAVRQLEVQKLAGR